MNLRVGIDLDGNRWIDWEGNSPPNLIPYPLWFNTQSGGGLNASTVDRQEISNYGLMIRQLIGGTNTNAGVKIGSNAAPLSVVTPGQTYTAVVWVKTNGNTLNGHLTALQDDGSTVIASSAASAVGSDWTKFRVVFTAPVGVTAIQLAFYRDGDSEFDIDVTGWGVYAGDTATNFNSGDLDGPSENIMPWVLGVSGDNGANDDFTQMTPIDGQLTVVLDNEDQDWTPRNTASQFYGLIKPRALVEVQIQENDDAEWVTLWSGFYETIEITPGTSSTRQAKIRALQGLVRIGSNRVTYKPTTSKTATEIIKSVLAGQDIPADRYSWRLNEAKMGVNTIFVSASAYSNLDDSAYVYPIAGAGLGEDTSMREFLNDLVTNEGGFAFFSRDGKFSFRTRDSLFPNIYEV